jgi:hypothetical protein
MRLVRLAALVVPSLLASSASAFTSDVLLRSGVMAPDGLALSSFAAPAASRPTRVVFDGASTAILTKDGSGFNVVVKTGDPLPSPLSGTFNSPADPAINDSGAIAFRASVNSTDAESGVFFFDGTTITTIALSGGTVGGANPRVSRNPDINNANHVVYENGNDTLLLWSGGSPVPIVNTGDPAPGGGTFTRFGERPVLNDSDVVAFQASVSGTNSGVFTWDAVNGVRAVALKGQPAPGITNGQYRTFAADTPVSINASGIVAFVADVLIPVTTLTTAVFGYDPSGPTVTKIANKGDAVGAETITAIVDVYAGVDDVGNVAFEARLPSGTRLIGWSGGPLYTLTGAISANEFAPRLTNAGEVVWRGSRSSIQLFDGSGVTDVMTRYDTTPLGVGVTGRVPSVNNLGVVAFRASHTALYEYDAGALAVVLAPGGPTPGGGTVDAVGARAARGSALAVRIDGIGFDNVLAFRRGRNPLAAVLRSTDTTPGGGLFDLADDIVDVSRQTIVFETSITDGEAASGVFRVNARTHAVETIALENDLAPNADAFYRFTAVAAAGRDVVFAAQLDSLPSGLFLWHRGTTTTIALAGDPAPGTSETFSSFASIATHGTHVVFSADLSNLASGVFTYDDGVLTKVAATGDPAPVGGTFTYFTQLTANFTPLVLASHGPAFVADTSGAPFEQLTAVEASTLVVRAADGDALAGGGTIATMDPFNPISLAGRAIIFDAQLDAASGASWGLLSNHP